MTWFKNLKTASKLMGGYATLSLLMVVAGLLALSGLQQTNEMLGTLYGKHLVGLSKISEAHVWHLHAARALRNALLATSPQEAERSTTEVQTSFEKLGVALRAMEPALTHVEAKAMLDTIRGIVPEWESQLRSSAQLAMAGKKTEAFEMMKMARINADRLQAVFDSLTEQKLRVGEEAFKESQVVYERSRAQLIGISVLSVLLGLGLGLGIARLIGRPLTRAAEVLDAVAARDFTQRLEISSQDEVGQMATSLNQAVEAVEAALLEVRAVADDVATAAQQLLSSSQEISSGAQEQASSLEETASSLEEITATVRQNAENAQQASQLGSGARDIADKGGAVVGEAVVAMGEINSASRRIADIITTIDEIAFQTNLLALNAAVEAARAGEQGRGFAVVATEVRSLAQRSGSAAREIKGLIQDSVRKVEGGTTLVNQSGERLQEIVASVKRVSDLVAEMASASREQSSSVEQVTKAVAQMDQVTQGNSAQTEELSATAESLTGKADQLRQLVAQFTLGGTEARRSSSRPSPKASPVRARRQVARRAARGSGTASASANSGSPAANGAAELDAAMVEALSSQYPGPKNGRSDFEAV